MTIDINKWNKFVKKLAEDTLSGKLTWEDKSNEISRDEEMGGIYLTFVLDNFVLVYPYRYQYYLDEDNYRWEDEVAVEIVTHDGRKLWKLPDVPSRHQLLNAVEYKLSGADEFADKFLGEDKDTE